MAGRPAVGLAPVDRHGRLGFRRRMPVGAAPASASRRVDWPPTNSGSICIKERQVPQDQGVNSGIFGALAEFERELIRERTLAGLMAARARGRKGGRKFALTKAQVRLAQAAMASRDTSVADLATELGVKPVTLYRYVSPTGELRENGRRVLRA